MGRGRLSCWAAVITGGHWGAGLHLFGFEAQMSRCLLGSLTAGSQSVPTSPEPRVAKPDLPHPDMSLPYRGRDFGVFVQMEAKKKFLELYGARMEAPHKIVPGDLQK